MIAILSWFLHHANRGSKDENFYLIKNRILQKYGRFVCYDIQFIEGKKCHVCGGTGVHHYYDFDGNVRDTDFCWHCFRGWYKRPVWNVLSRIQFGRYEFHQPYQRCYEKPDNSIPIIEGYIDHDRSKYNDFARTILFLIYERGYLKRWWKHAGLGWCLAWWLPKNWPNNIVHLLKHGSNSLPFRRMSIKKVKKYGPVFETQDDLMPF